MDYLDVHQESECLLDRPSPGILGHLRACDPHRGPTSQQLAGSMSEPLVPVGDPLRPDRPVVANVTSHQETTVFLVCLDIGQQLPEHPAPARSRCWSSRGNRRSRSTTPPRPAPLVTSPSWPPPPCIPCPPDPNGPWWQASSQTEVTTSRSAARAVERDWRSRSRKGAPPRRRSTT